MTDDDWFERALQDEEDGDEDAPFSTEDDGAVTESDRAGDAEREDGDDGGGDADTSDNADSGGGPFGGGDGGGGDSPFGGDDGDEDSPFGGDESGEDNPFGSDDGGNGANPFGGDESGEDNPFGGDESGEDNPFGGGDGGGGDSPFGGDDAGSPFGGGGESGGGDLFDDDFASAFGGGEGGDDEFDDEDFESDIPRIDLGIRGLDDMIQGGIPERHLITCIGSAGTGKTTFGLQFLQHGLQKEDPEKAVFITLEQSKEAIMATANERDWAFERYEEEDLLAVVDLDPVEMANSLDNIRAELPDLVRDFGADRLVLDSVSLLEMMYDDVSKRRTEVFDFTRSLKRAGVTTMLTSEASEEYSHTSRHGIIEYLTDAVVHLRYVRQETRETRMAVEIQKIRNANHSRETKPYEITGEGISVYQQANIF